MPTSANFTEIDKANIQAGDIILQASHMGIYTRTDANGQVMGIQMGNHAVQQAPWGEGGWFANPDALSFYRPIIPPGPPPPPPPE